jgi:hypothetical protein
VSDARAAYAGMPALDLKRRTADLDRLQRELDLDARRVPGAPSTRDAILDEVVDTLAHWAEDIWSVVFEFRTEFALAHRCLLAAATTVYGVCEACMSPTGCVLRSLAEGGAVDAPRAVML